jgi:hypothetical protein
MTNPLQDFGRTIQDLITRSLNEQVRAAQRYNQLLQRSGSGQLFDKSVRDNYFNFLNHEASEYARTVAKLSFNYYHDLMGVGREYTDKFFEQVLSAPGVGADATTVDATAQPRIYLELRGIVGQRASRTFILENKRTEATEISFQVSEFVDSTGNVRFNPRLQIQPERFMLAPGEERVVEMALQIDPAFFAAEQRYSATALAQGCDLELSIVVVPLAPAGPEVEL